MEASLLLKVAAPLVLALMMLGMGLTLVVDDFKRIFVYPKAVMLGTVSQMVLLPLVAFLLVSIIPVSPVIAAGVMILAACPGGPGSNLLALICKGDVALSVTLTVVSSLLACITIPVLVEFMLAYFLEQKADLDPVKLFKRGLLVTALTVVPVIIGMALRHRFLDVAERSQSPVKIASVIFLLIVISAIAYKERENLVSMAQQAGLVAIVLCVTTMSMGYALARLFRLDTPQRRSIMIEVGIQNAALAFVITTVMLESSSLAVPAAMYSPTMLTIAIILVAWYTWKGEAETRL